MYNPITMQKLSREEGLLLEYVRRLDRHRKGRRAVHIHLSQLRPQNRREHHIRIAANSFEGFVGKSLGSVFQLDNSDLIFIFKSLVEDDVKAAILKLRFLFSDDPLLATDEEEAVDRFCTWFDVETEYDKLKQHVLDLLAHLHDDKTAAKRVDSAKAALLARQKDEQTLTPQILARVEESLGRADLSNVLRRQTVCAVVGKAPQPVFSELFISIKDLREMLLPDINVVANRWLFQHLTETLDRRMLAMLTRHDDGTLAGEISINLNVSTLLSQEFLTFDDRLKASMRGMVVVELQKVDIFADLGAFLFARDFIRDRGYRICVDGLTHMTLPFVDRDRLGVDMVKLVWSPDMADAGRDEVAGLIKRTGENRVILCRCDNQEAIEFGQSVGIQMFQGRHVENMLAEDVRKRTVLIRR